MKFAARQASDGPAPATHAAYDVGGLGGSPDEQARVAVRHQGDGPAGRIRRVRHAAGNAQPDARPPTLTCSNLKLATRRGSPDTPTPEPPI